MGGTTKFEDALAARLNLMQPSCSAVAAYLDAHPPSLSPGVPALVAVVGGEMGRHQRPLELL